MNFTKGLEMTEESRKKVNAVLFKQREKIALLESQIERAFNAGFSIGFGSERMENLEGQFNKFRELINKQDA